MMMVVMMIILIGGDVNGGGYYDDEDIDDFVDHYGDNDRFNNVVGFTSDDGDDDAIYVYLGVCR